MSGVRISSGTPIIVVFNFGRVQCKVTPESLTASIYIFSLFNIDSWIKKYYVLLKDTTHSIWCVIGNKSKPIILFNL